MKPKHLFLSASAFSLLLLGAACLTCQQREEDRPYRSGTLAHFEDGTLRKARMAEEAQVAGYPVREGGWVHFYETGAIKGLQLGQEFEIAGRLIPAQSMVWFDEQGAMKTAWLSEDRIFGGVPCAGGFMKVATSFYSDGTLRSAFLSEDAEVQGLPCAASAFSPVRFHSNGQLAGAKLSRDCEYRGTALRDGDEVQLDEDGGLLR